MKQWALRCATLGPIGYYPGSGTWATCAAIPLVYGLQRWFGHNDLYGIIVLFFVLMSWMLVDSVLRRLRTIQHDPSEIVIDEIVGCLITFAGIPLTIKTGIIGIVLFRFFDITKIGFIGYVERWSGATGIIIDDVLAALIANIIMRCLL